MPRSALIVLSAMLTLAPTTGGAEEPFFSQGTGGWVTLSGGARAILQPDFSGRLADVGQSLQRHDWIQPAFFFGANYRFDPQWAVRGELGWSQDRYHFGDGTMLDVQTFALQLAVEWLLPVVWSRVQPYAQGGLGYYFSGITAPVSGLEQTTTDSSTGGSLALGVRIAVTSKFGLSFEERYAFAFSALSSLGSASVGGNTVALGVYYVSK